MWREQFCFMADIADTPCHNMGAGTGRHSNSGGWTCRQKLH
ncbi:Hypothetical protein ETEE_0165 [Edwardsiella anguillarum ET080813]|uniref:Uncharacterized protein n=1 Tax=Edwardsiella anguillarum ET080813 TaxID=667120 RepID=A0A076LLV2_9GAMM|nr:Hypothetical protein ETEE_0165 [Edwardsiella anguillarum ET080813]